MPRIDAASLWRRHVEAVHAILTRALLDIAGEPVRRDELGIVVDCTASGENAINRSLYFALLSAIREERCIGSRHALDHAPVYEGNSQPSPDDRTTAAREGKRPDFQWCYIDHEADPERSHRAFVIECKCLGTPRRADWPFNLNYVRHGILRFVDASHLYGRDDADGAMVGYLQSMEPQEILAELNAAAAPAGLREITIAAAGWAESVSTLDQVLDRTQGHARYALRHFWVDLRPCVVSCRPKFATTRRFRQRF